MRKQNRLFVGALFAMIALLSQCITPPQLTEAEKAVKFAPPARKASLALNDSCSVVAVRRFPMAGDQLLRQFAITNKSNVVQYFLTSKGASSSSSYGGTTSSTAMFSFFYRFWHCPTITKDVEPWVSDLVNYEESYDE